MTSRVKIKVHGVSISALCEPHIKPINLIMLHMKAQFGTWPGTWESNIFQYFNPNNLRNVAVSIS